MKRKNTIISVLSLLLILFSVIAVNNTNTYATGTVYIHVDFDNASFPPAGWTVANTSNYNWIRTTYCSGYGTGVSSACADFYDYASGNFDLITKTFPASTSGDSLKFDHAYTTGSTETDRLDIYTSADGGTTWTLLISIMGGPSGPLRTATPTYHLFVPTAGQWATKSYALPTGTNKIKFQGVTAFGNNLYLDNVKIGAAYSNDVGVNAVIEPKWAITPQAVAPVAYVRNFGTTPQTFTVTYTISPGSYTNTQTVTNLAPGTTQLVTFSSNNFTATGNYTLRAYTTLTGDQNSSNDTITNPLIVTNSPRKVVLEFCTGTWCQWCPCGDNEAKNLENAYPNNAVIFAYHGASTDPWKNFNGNTIINLLGLNGYPSGYIDRRLGAPNNSWGSFFTDGEYRLSQSGEGGVNITITSLNYNSGTRQFTANVDATALSNLTGQYKINCVITEGNLVYAQTGNSYCPGSSTWVHHWVARNMVNGALGENLNTGNWNMGQTISKTFTDSVAVAWNSANVKINFFVYKDNGNLTTSEVQQGTNAPVNPIGISNEQNGVPSKYELSQNYPNPFNPVTNIHFTIPKEGKVSLKLYNSIGQLVATYLDGIIKPGYYNAEVEAFNFASGVYFYTLSAGDFIETKKMVLIK